MTLTAAVDEISDAAIPVVDVSAAVAGGTPEATAEAAAALGRAGRSIGFVQCVADGEPADEPVSVSDWNMRYFKKKSLVLRLADEQ